MSSPHLTVSPSTKPTPNGRGHPREHLPPAFAVVREYVFLAGPFTDAAVTCLAALLGQIAARRADEVWLILNSEGGPFGHAVTVANLLALQPYHVTTINAGLVSGNAVIPYLSASRRLAMPGALFALHPGGASMSPDDARAIELIAATTKFATRQTLVRTVSERHVLSAADALAVGLLTEPAQLYKLPAGAQLHCTWGA